MSQRNRVWIAMACVSAGLLVVGAVGCLGALVLLLPNGPKHAREYLSQVQVDPAYRQIGEGGQGNCNCNLEYTYVGPSQVEAARVFSGPALTLQPSDGSIAAWDRLLTGEGASEASGHCRLGVYRYPRDREPFDEWNLKKLSTDERALVSSGDLVVLRLYVSCERDYG
ncbi:hypothetical protein [Micromonospora sp. CB01531]|uniref:hypothetical protein n=1 Tax=Micromonospora sp. CB01531 TaxID=1718947 RepID=UPI00093C3229|nr:hypothetical protein [Micromonospora sp. CB01531]OKI62319.1 hypothetical protein A6A27_04845 [Micromonospora sp. CB01531]